MSVRPEFLALVLACALVTALPRVLPLVVLSRVALPRWLLDWLGYVPVAVLAALTAIEVLVPGGHALLLRGNPAIPAVAVAFLLATATRSLLVAVLGGVAAFWLIA